MLRVAVPAVLHANCDRLEALHPRLSLTGPGSESTWRAMPRVLPTHKRSLTWPSWPEDTITYTPFNLAVPLTASNG